jgi:F-type H+-transporting ATPase subunit b
MLENTDVVVGIAFVLFIGVLWYFNVHNLLARALDRRADRIRGELDEARRLREEAQSLLASYERKQKEVDGQVQDIISHARTEAEESAAQARKDLEVSIQRRLRAAEEQIQSAEDSALRSVRDEAIRVAVAAAGEAIAKNMSPEARAKLTDEGIRTVSAKLH